MARWKSYNSFANDYDGYTRGMNFVDSYDYGKPSSKMIDAMYRMNQKRSALQIDDSRSMLDRTFDALMTPLYTTAGFTRGLVNEEFNPLEGMIGGLRASNPFGDGYEEGEHTYSKFLEDLGWKPESTLGKIAKGTAGFVLDVALDPTTYLSGGASALIKGTGRTADVVSGLGKIDETIRTSHGNIVNDLVSKGIDPGLASRFADKKIGDLGDLGKVTTHMTDESAESIIRLQNYERGIKLGDEEIKNQASKLAKEYNRLTGIRDIEKTPITWGVGNMPFMPKKWQDKTVTLGNGDTLRKLGDELGFAEGYSELRKFVYGSQIGKLLSTTAPLYKLSQEDPAKLYDYMQFIEHTRGLKIDKLKQEKSIRDYAKSTLKLTDAESKEVLDLLQDKTVWHKIASRVRFSDVEEIKKIKDVLTAKKAETNAQLDELVQQRQVYDNLSWATDKEIVENNELLQAMKEQYRNELSKIDAKNIDDRDKLSNLVYQYQREIGEIDDILSRQQDDPMRALLDEDYNSYITSDKTVSRESAQKLIDTLSAHIYGETGALSYTLGDHAIDDLMKEVRKGASPEELRFHIEDSPESFSPHVRNVNQAVADQLGYKYWHKDGFKEPLARLLGKTDPEKSTMKELQEELSSRLADGKFNTFEMQEVNRLLNLDMQRRILRRQYMNITPEELTAIRTQLANSKMYDEVNSILEEDEVFKWRDQFVDEDSAIHDTEFNFGDARNGQHVERSRKTGRFNDNTAFNANLSKAEKQELIFDMIELGLFKASTIETAKSGNATLLRYINRVAEEVEVFIKDKFNREYHQLTDGQKKFAFKMATDKASKVFNKSKQEEELALRAQIEASKRANEARIKTIESEVGTHSTVTFKKDGEWYKGKVEEVTRDGSVPSYNVRIPSGEVVQGVKSGEITRVKVDKQNMTPDDLIASSGLASEHIKQKEKLNKQLSDALNNLDEVNRSFNEDKEKLLHFFSERAKEQKQVIRELEDNKKKYDEMLGFASDEEIEKLAKKVADQEDVLKTDEALDTYLRSQGYDVDDWIAKAQPTNAGRIFLEQKASSKKIENIVRSLRATFDDVGEAEKAIGKLGDEQFEAMLGRYVPHILTPDGAKYFKAIEEIKEHGSALTHDLGYGNAWNPYRQSRTIQGKSIEEINEYFRDKLQGKNLFSENVADIYIERMLKHNELMYDDKYMKTMMDTFGKPIDGLNVEEGYKAVANIGQLKREIRNAVRQRAQMVRQNGGSVDEAFWNRETANILGKLDMPENILDEGATPMVELSSSQLERMQRHLPHITRQVNDAIVQKANQTRKLQIAKDHSRFLQVYDKFLHFIKLNQTTVMPAFHMRNKMSNMFLNWLGVGRDAVNPVWQKNAIKVAMHQGNVEKLGNMRPINIPSPHASLQEITNSGQLHWNELYELAKDYDVIDEGFFAQDIGAGAMSRGMIEGVPAKLDPTDTENFVLYQKGAQVGTVVENSDRIIHFASMLRRGHSIEDSAKSSRQFLFDYSDLTAFEQHVMKRVMPYYTWLRKNSRLQVSQVLEQPGKYQRVAKAIQGVEGMNNEEDKMDSRYVSNFAQDWVQTPFSSTNGMGNREPILWNPNLPFMDIGRLPDPFNPVQSAKELFAQTSPQIKLPVEYAMNKNVFFDAPIAEEDESLPIEYAKHAVGQLAMANAVSGSATKDGLDQALFVGNILTGQKFLSYDEEASKYITIQKAIESGDRDLFDNVRNSIQSGAVSFIAKVDGGIKEGFKDGILSLTGQPPKDASDYSGALRPISSATYNALSEEEKEKYTPPTKEEVFYYNKKALELEKKAYEESGVASRFVWTLLDGVGKQEEFTIGKIQNVTDGDTFTADIGGDKKEIRMILVDTPETVHPSKPKMPMGEEASDYGKSMLLGKDVKLIFDGDKEDTYGRTLAYVQVDGEDYGKDLVRKGLGKTRYTYKDFPHNINQYNRTDEYFNAERQANQENLGIWQDKYSGYARVGRDKDYNLSAVERYIKKLNRGD